jgi:hypothetical protein
LIEEIQYFEAHVRKLEKDFPGALERIPEVRNVLVPVGPIGDWDLVHLMKTTTILFHGETAYVTCGDRLKRWDRQSSSWVDDESEDRTVEYPS